MSRIGLAVNSCLAKTCTVDNDGNRVGRTSRTLADGAFGSFGFEAGSDELRLPVCSRGSRV